ncbi:MAG: sigma-54-dependent Fis family transcriptional regulator [Pseudobdellovibrionaceae bacterium]|nr:sigma-54-dependent Fis family transcriptional regulator [Bdellovibrionales bacterium]USN47303.1 MAG: sigma-54-dependent Fis family transcriptional regulator [Pseudobdellovibrionaceae bacterium]
MLKVLVVDDDAGLRLSVKKALNGAGQFEVYEAFDGVNALEKIQSSDDYNMVLMDVDMPRMNGLQALQKIKEHDPSIIVIIMTAYARIDDAVKAVKEGAFDYVSKPIKGDELVDMVDQALRTHSLISDVALSSPVLTMESGRKIIGNTAQMKKMFHIINKLSKVQTPVLIRGASGTGKELVARAIHMNSAQRTGKFVAINCSAIPENLFESELFGHEKGAFTGADQRKIGKFQFAEGGTLFLDEVGDMPQLMQVKLLRVLQERVFTPVGSNREIETNVRIIAATNRPLEDMIQKNDFREDLYYRLNVMPIFLPPLKERKGDLDQLVGMFIKRFNDRHDKKITGLSPEALACFKKYDWPGNIRELENVIEHAFILEDSPQINLSSLPESFLSATGISPTAVNLKPSSAEDSDGDGDAATAPISGSETEDLVQIKTDNLDFNRHKEAFEREFIVKALKMFKGRINQTALHANIPKKTLLRKIEKYGIVARDYADQ